MTPDSEQEPDTTSPQHEPVPSRRRLQGQRTHTLSGLLLGLMWGTGVGIAFSFQQAMDGEFLFALGALALGFMAGMAAGLVRWWFTRYIIDETEIRVETGPIFHSSRRIPFARLQSVDINQPFIARILGLAELRIEMAGGSESHTTLRYLEIHEARRLRALILDRSHGTVAAEQHDDDRRSLITHVPPQRLVLGTFLSLDLMAMLLGSVAIIVVFLVADISFAVIGGLIPLIFGTFQMISSRIIAQWDFTLTRGERGLRITRGLLSRSSQTIPFDRVQGIRIVEPFIWRRLGWLRLDVDVAGYGAISSESGVASTTLLPISDPLLAQALINELIPDPDAANAVTVRVSKRSRIFAPIGWRYRWLRRSADTVQSGTGWITRRTSLVPHHKVQSVSIDQGPWQRRLKVGSLSVHTPDGPVEVRVRHLDDESLSDIALDEVNRAREARARQHRAPKIQDEVTEPEGLF